MESTDPDPLAAPHPPRRSLWQIYKSRFIPTQAFILVCCALMYFVVEMQPATVLAAFLFVQLAAVWGAWSGKRLLDRIEGENDGVSS